MIDVMAKLLKIRHVARHAAASFDQVGRRRLCGTNCSANTSTVRQKVEITCKVRGKMLFLFSAA
jgi:hypothetical protein